MPRHSDNAPDVMTSLVSLWEARGHSQYGGEAVTQLEHALQTAHAAEQAGAGPALIAAALLHDLGHLLHSLPDDAPERGVDDRHESLAAKWLCQHFGPDVFEPVRLHVAAKRCLCAVEPDYQRQLSPPSALSLELQGGAMTAREQAEFAAHPQFRDAVLLRRWDDSAKQTGLITPGLAHFLPFVEAALRPGSR